MPKRGNKAIGPVVTKMTDESLAVHPDMIDRDNVEGFDTGFKAKSSITEGISGQEMIDTLYENTSQDYVENPREGSTPAPECLTGPLYPHRRL